MCVIEIGRWCIPLGVVLGFSGAGLLLGLALYDDTVNRRWPRR